MGSENSASDAAAIHRVRTSPDRQRRDLRPAAPLNALRPEVVDAIVLHPEQKATFQRIRQMVADLRACTSDADFFAFQRDLLGEAIRVGDERSARSRVVKRLSRGQGVPSDAPDLPDGVDATHLVSWEIDEYVYERISRQLRSVGDALAWRRVGYDRRIVLALGSNQSPGPIYSKPGLRAEREFVERLWRDDGRFGLLHDLTNCLRIGDVSEFREAGVVRLHEVKSSARFSRAQQERAQQAVDAIIAGGPLPGTSDARFVEVPIPYRTNLAQLHDVLQLAKARACQGLKLPGKRALHAASLVRMAQRWGSGSPDGVTELRKTRQAAVQRAGIASVSHHLTARSGDTAARSRVMAPFAIYPLNVDDAAALICDLAVFESIVAVEALTDALSDVGLHSEVLVPDGHSNLTLAQPVLRAFWRDRALTLHNQGLGTLLYELVDPQAWAQGVKNMISSPAPPAEPQLIFAGESSAWL